MARSTKIQKVVTDALAVRITATEGGITTIANRNLLDAGDNVSELVNDAQYQTATQVLNSIQTVVGAAPAALNTLEEIADKLATEDSAIAALVAQDTANATAITAIQQKNANQDTAIAAIQTNVTTLQNQEYGITISQGDNFFQDGLTQNVEILGALLTQLAPGIVSIDITPETIPLTLTNPPLFPLNVGNVSQALNYLSTSSNTQNAQINDLATDVAALQSFSGKIQLLSGELAPYASVINFVASDFDVVVDQEFGTVSLNNNVFNLNRFELDPVGYPFGSLGGAIDLLLRNNAIRRLDLTGGITLNISDAARQNLINQTASAVTVGLPNNSYTGLEFEVINHTTSTQNITFAGETIVPGTRHAVQWDGVEWVVM